MAKTQLVTLFNAFFWTLCLKHIRNEPQSIGLPPRPVRLTGTVCLIALILHSLCETGLGQESSAIESRLETLPELIDKRPPANYEELWREFDPRREPLETEVLHQWETDKAILKIVRFRIGMFKGKKAKLAAIFGYPKTADAKHQIPGLLQIHGGGQYADYRACEMNAQAGYATLSISWAGRINAPDYKVTPAEVKLFWEDKKSDPNYRLTTDWGAVDAYHAPSRNRGNSFPSIRSWPWTLDSVDSPRNSGWFLAAVAARRALTFLERQAMVDPKRLGVYGHSMGGKLTVMTAPDKRVKAAAPSCGGISDRVNQSELFLKTLGDDVSLKKITCPIAFLSPANDFHGRIGDLPSAVNEIKSDEWRVICSPHHNHQDTPPYEVATLLWFDQFLKQQFSMPKTPKTNLELRSDSGIPLFQIRPDPTQKPLSIDVYYTQQGKVPESPSDMKNTIARFWHHVPASQQDTNWEVRIPVHDPGKPLWIYANVTYRLPRSISGAGYYYGVYSADTYVVSSLIEKHSAEELQTAKVLQNIQSTTVIEDFQGDWEKEWFAYRPNDWGRSTHKIGSDIWKAPKEASMVLEIRSETPNAVVVRIDDFATEVALKGTSSFEKIRLAPGDFSNADGKPLASWAGIRTLEVCPRLTLRPPHGSQSKPKRLGRNWKGKPPEFRKLSWSSEKSSN